AERGARKRPTLPNLVQSGSFALVNGQVIVAGLSEDGRTAQTSAPSGSSGQNASARTATRIPASANTVTRLRNHRLSLLSSGFMPDQVIADDLIVQGSVCAGLDCVNNESFSFDTLRLKENNTRISFVDTSSSAGFPTEDWTIRANASGSGGASFLAFVDRGASSSGDESGTIVFEVDAGAPVNSLKVDSGGRVGLRTATPVLDLHVNTNNTPAMRYEQNNSGGFNAQTWDIGANEANFFVRDVTSGSRLPFRIRPGAPTSSIDINANGNVGIGTASASQAKLVIAADSSFEIASSGVADLDITTPAGTGGRIILGTRTGSHLTVDTAGNVGIGTTLPDQKLSVNGDADKVGGGSWLNFSDERLK